MSIPSSLPPEWHNPPVEFSLAPFWFWNDDLTDAVIAQQIGDFQAHGVDAFVIHPRVGLPRYLGWMSRPLLDRMRFAIQQAKARGMGVLLYDEGMYPSGSSSGQVVAENPAYQCRGLVKVDLDAALPGQTICGVTIGSDGVALTPGQNLVAIVPYEGHRIAIIDQPVNAVIRGLHFIHENADEPPEDTPLAADLLNPEAVACFIRMVYDRYYQEFGEFFGDTIHAIFTDEPNLLGRLNDPEVRPGTSGILQHVNDFLGYDFTPHLPALWDDSDQAARHIQDYNRTLEQRLQQTYYRQLYEWCEAHHIALTGHPAEPDATAHMRFFHIPGQDIVWRFIEPDKRSALEGAQSTQAKAAASVMLHRGRRRNANEFCGAYGPEMTFDEVRWLANWLLIRGCSLLIPHAFYYSVRGPRLHERPPDVGPNSPWWDDFKPFADASRRLCWLNTDSQPVCHVAILGENHALPWRAARVCFENQIDFHYLDDHDLAQVAAVDSDGIIITSQHYDVLILDNVTPLGVYARLETLEKAGRLVRWNDDSADCITRLCEIIPADITLSVPCPGLRVRHVKKSGLDWYMLFNEGAQAIDTSITFAASGTASIMNPDDDTSQPFDGHLHLAGHMLRVVLIRD